MSTPSSLVLVAVDGGIATVTLNRADKRNALNGELMLALAAALDGIAEDPQVRVAVGRGGGPACRSGIDHPFWRGVTQKAQALPFPPLPRIRPGVFHRLSRLEKPTIGALH